MQGSLGHSRSAKSSSRIDARQVSWLMGIRALRERDADAFPGLMPSGSVPVSLPTHSGGTAAEFHGLPCYHPNFGYRTLGLR